MSPRRLTAVLALTALALASCTTEQSSTPAPTLTSTTSSTTTTTAATTVPEVTTTTPDSTDVTTTLAPTTTLPPGPADVQVPLLIGGAGGGWLYLGAWLFDQWSPAFDDDDEPITPSIGPGTAMTVSSLGPDTSGELGAFTEACFDGRNGPTLDVTVAAPEPPGFGYAAVALPTRAWPLTPRPVAVTASGPASYQAIGEAAFADEPVDPTLGAIDEVVIADLDGDGDDEALAVFEHIQPDTIVGAPGDFAGLLLIDATSRASSTVISSSVDQDLDPDGFPIIERFRVIDVADYNGDGRMEVAVHAWYYEGASVVVYEYDGTALDEVLVTGCGA